MSNVPARLRRAVVRRAHGRCEYCRIHQDDVILAHEPDHIIAIKHGGKTVLENLANACLLCNRFKGSDIASIDRLTGAIVRLFDPRNDRWDEHFRVATDGRIVPLTAIGRVTERLLKFNLLESRQTRKLLMEEGGYPL